jgi:phage major head subunit gpT-like protein
MSDTKTKDPLVIQAAFARSCGLQNLDKHFKPEVLEAADKLRGWGLQETLLYCAKQNGYDGDRGVITHGNISEVLRAGFSTHSLTTLLTTTGNKMLLDGFAAIPATWREVAKVVPVSDFKASTLYRLTTSLEYAEVGPAGEIPHGTVGQDSYTIQANTYGKLFVLPRQDIINDDMGAFNAIRDRLGMGSAIKLNRLFWTAWLAASEGAAFWTSARSNLVTSAALAEAGLNKAVAAFRAQTGPDGNQMALEPDRVVVPPDIEATARVLYSSMEVRNTIADTKYPTNNAYYNRFRPVVVPELGNILYTGYSPSTYWLACRPDILASAAVCFLGGQESPTIESAEADFDTLGLQFRGYHDFGMTMSEFRASTKCTAA